MVSTRLNIKLRRQASRGREQALFVRPNIAIPSDAEIVDGSVPERAFLTNFNITAESTPRSPAMRFSLSFTPNDLDLIDGWWDWERAIILELGGSRIFIPGPQDPTYATERVPGDRTWGVGWSATGPESIAAIQAWIRRLTTSRAGTGVVMTLTDGATTVSARSARTSFSFRQGNTPGTVGVEYRGRGESDFDFNVRPISAFVTHAPVGVPAPIPFIFRGEARGVADITRLVVPRIGDTRLNLGEETRVFFRPAIGGIGAKTHSIQPALPPGITFDEDSISITGIARFVLPATEYRLIAEDTVGDTAEARFLLSVETDLTPEIPDFVYAWVLDIEPYRETPAYRFSTEPVSTVIDGTEYQPGFLEGIVGAGYTEDGPLTPTAILHTQENDPLYMALREDPGARRCRAAIYQYFVEQDEWVLKQQWFGTLGEGAPNDDGLFEIDIDPDTVEIQESQIRAEWSHEFQQQKAPGDQFFVALRKLATDGKTFQAIE